MRATPEADWPRTLDEFRAWHARQPELWEFIDGVPRLMAPASKAHTTIKGNVYAALRAALRATGCQAFVDGAQIEGDNFSAIPDVVVTCGPEDFSTPRVDAPVIVVEVLSPGTEKDDVERKLHRYLAIPSVRHVLIVHQDERRIVHYERRDDLGGSFLANIAPPDPLRLDSPGVSLPFAAVYEGVPLDPPA